MKLIRLSKSCISDAENNAVIDVMNRGYLGMGQDVEEFEAQLISYFGRPVVCVSTGTAALQLALQSCGIGFGDEVLVQSLTYIATFQAISATGAKPIACDIDPATMTLDWRDAEKRITKKTKAVMPVHYSGGVGSLDDIYKFAGKYGLRVIEDAAHAFGSYVLVLMELKILHLEKVVA
jgi:dTDP-4-amino-4,6-dideoxygalactose transaminase